MDSQDASGFDETRAELFEALGHQTRIRILQELGRKPMGFSELKHAVDLESGGLLSFHLRKLTHLVKSTQAGDYALTDEGREALGVIGAVRNQGLNGQIKHARPWKLRLIQRKVLAGLIVALILVPTGAYFYETNSSANSIIASQSTRIGLLQNLTSQFQKELANGTLVHAGSCNLQTPSFQAAVSSYIRSLVFTNQSFGGLWYSELGAQVNYSNIGWLGYPLGQGGPTDIYNGSASPSKSFGHPAGFAFHYDSSVGFFGLWVADPDNFRVVVINAINENTGGANGSIGLAIGKELAYGRASSSSMFVPFDVAFDASGNLWVADTGDSRVLEFSPPFSTGMSASVVIGQHNFTSWGQHVNGMGLPTTASGLGTPWAIRFDSLGNLWVSDGTNNRILEFRPPFTSGMNASLVIGQPNFTTNGVGPVSLGRVNGMAFDSRGNLWIASYELGIVEFSPPFKTGMAPTTVYGGMARALAFDSNGNLWVAGIYLSEYGCRS